MRRRNSKLILSINPSLDDDNDNCDMEEMTYEIQNDKEAKRLKDKIKEIEE